MPLLRAVLVAALLPLSGCSSVVPPPEHALREGAQDTRCAAALAAWRARPKDPELALVAARELFAVADVEVQRALVAAVEAARPTSPAAVLAAEAELPASVKERVVSLATAGAEAAQTASDGGQGVEADVLLAQHLSFLAWANGPMRALFAGQGRRIEAAMARALATDERWNHGAPLRLRGRFLCQAPWPLRNVDAGAQLLQRAVEIAPLPIHHLFFGDALFLQGKREAAREQWRAALSATPDETTAPVAPLHRRLCELRLDSDR